MQPNRGIGKYSEINKKIIWGKSCHGGHPCCRRCGTTKIRHKGAGLCIHCYDKSRSKQSKRKAQLKNQYERWYKRVKGTEKYKKYTNERALAWSKTPTGRGARYRWYQKQRLIRFIEGGRIKKEYIKIICSCCKKEYVAPFKKSDLPDKEPWLMLYRRMLIEKHALL